MNTNEILIITSFPPRKCGIATYSQDLMNAIEDKYADSFKIKVCALQKLNVVLEYPHEVKYLLKTWLNEDYKRLAIEINADEAIKVIYLQHEFGLFEGNLGDYILDFLELVQKPVITTFHTVLANPNPERKILVQKITELSSRVIVMTHLSAKVLEKDYQILAKKIKVIPHGTHLIRPLPLNQGEAVPFKGKTVISTFGLISAGKGIETALDALPKIIAKFPEVLYLIIGKTHPEVLKNEGEKYRNFLEEKVQELKLQNNVLFVNKYLELDVLLEYLQRTDIYFFTSKDPQQAVSGTLAYALSAGCPVISTPIPHSLELLDGAGVNFDFENAQQLADATLMMLYSPKVMEEMRLNALHRISPTAWQNAAIAHIDMAKNLLDEAHFQLSYKMPAINLAHINRMTTDFGMIQFAKIADPDLLSGYTLDDNARALIAIAQHFEIAGNFSDLPIISIYLKFILFCQQTDGSFLNYVTTDKEFFEKNANENLEDANGRAIWALGEFLSLKQPLDAVLQAKVEAAFQKAIPTIHKLNSPRAIAFCIKGLYYYQQFKKDEAVLNLITKLADNLVSKYRGVSTRSADGISSENAGANAGASVFGGASGAFGERLSVVSTKSASADWHWYEEYLTYANALLPEAMLLAGECTGNSLFKEIAHKTFDFLLKITFKNNQISVISNQSWHHKGKDKSKFGEQPIEIAYTILALERFYKESKNKMFLDKMKIAFNWFLGENHLHQIIYNPSTAGCYDGLEQYQVNLNQGAESAVSYLLSRLVMEKYVY